MDLAFSASEEAFRDEVRTWMADHLVGDFASLGTGGRLGEGDELDLRKAWERELASGGWVGMGWPARYGGRDLPLAKQIIFNEEYVRSGGPNRVGFFGEELLGPTLMMFGTDEQKSRFLPGIHEAEEFLVPGFQRTRCRFGPGQRQDDGGPRRRRMGDQRAEGVDEPRTHLGLDLRRVPHGRESVEET